MKIWNFGIIGAGLIADFHAKAIQSLGNARLTGICGTNSTKVRALCERYNCKSYTDVSELLGSGRVDIVTIATPSGAHMEPAVEAAKYGVHVICEKPLEISFDRIDMMIKAHKVAGTRLGGIFNYRYNETTHILKKALSEGRFGTITYASVHVPWWRNDSYYENSWHGTLKLDGGGALMNQAIHMIDILQFMMGPVDSLFGYTATLGHKIEAEDTGVAVLQFRNKALGVIYGSTASYPGQFRRLEITGTGGTVVMEENSFRIWQFSDKRDEDEHIRREFNNINGGGGVSDPSAIPFEPHAKNISAFINAIETKGTFEIEGEEARKAVEIIIGIYTSSRQGRPYFFSK